MPAASRAWKRRETNCPTAAARRANTSCSPHENHFWTSSFRKHMKINRFCFKSPSLWSFVTVAIRKQHPPHPQRGLSPHRRSGDFLFHNDPSAVGGLNREARQPDQLQALPLASRASLQTVSQLLCHLLISHTEPLQERVPYNGRENPRRDGPSSQTRRGSPRPSVSREVVQSAENGDCAQPAHHAPQSPPQHQAVRPQYYLVNE